jgi:proteasome assembly chaperone (PAC2) family protein
VSDGLVWDWRPDLRDPLLVAAFEGWNDAGDAASGAADWLIRRSRARRFASIDPEEHIDYQSHRPLVELVDGVTRSITWPANAYFAASFPERDMVVLRGVEPNVRWKSFCRTVLTVASETGCSTVVTLGALLGDVPHTRTVRVTGAATDPAMVGRLGLVRSRYEGPTGIVGVLHDACQSGGVPSASLWAPVPHYVATPPNPPGTRALLERLSALTGISVDLTELDEQADTWRAQVDDAMADDEDVKDYVRQLEARVDAESAAEEGVVLGDSLSDADLPSGDDLADELQRFLRDRRDDT